MTGYGAGQSESDDIRVNVECRSVNHRHCDVQMRIPREYMALEPRLRAMVRESYRRGRVELFVRRTDIKPLVGDIRVNVELARAYKLELDRLKAALDVPGAIDVALLLNQAGVVSTVEVQRDPEQDWPVIEDAVRRALEESLRMRQAEGAALRVDIHDRLMKIRALHGHLRKVNHVLPEERREMLERRLGEVFAEAKRGTLDESRLLQEIVYLVDRADISEELTRVESHLDQFVAALDEDDVVGRKMEFLVQELLRETNTMGSKSSSAEVARATVSIKMELEKIREQIQNIE